MVISASIALDTFCLPLMFLATLDSEDNSTVRVDASVELVVICLHNIEPIAVWSAVALLALV
jgi:hypothetical protein